MPSLGGRPEHCLSCGYSLEGLPAPGACPECGLEFYGGISSIRIAGVAKRGPGPKWRKPVWVVLFIATFLWVQGIGVMWMTGMLWLSLLLFAAIVAGMVAMGVTAKQGSVGSEYFSITEAGFGRIPTGEKARLTEFVPWGEGTPAVRIERVGKYWAKIHLVRKTTDAKPEVLLDAGFRCPAEDLLVVEQLIVRLMNGEGLEDRDSVSGYDTSVLMASDVRLSQGGKDGD